MKRVFLVLLVSAVVLGGFLIAALSLEKDRFSDTAITFIERLWKNSVDPELYKLTSPDQFLDFYAPETLNAEIRNWREILGAYRGPGERRGVTEMAPGRTQVTIQFLFDNGSAEARVEFQERKGAHLIERFAFDFEPGSRLPPDPRTALATAYEVGNALRGGDAPTAWKLMSFELHKRMGTSRLWDEMMRTQIGVLSDPQDPESIEPFAFDKDDPSQFKGTWTTKHDDGTLWVRMTLRWKNVAWYLDDIELKRLP